MLGVMAVALLAGSLVFEDMWGGTPFAAMAKLRALASSQLAA